MIQNEKNNNNAHLWVGPFYRYFRCTRQKNMYEKKNSKLFYDETRDFVRVAAASSQLPIIIVHSAL